MRTWIRRCLAALLAAALLPGAALATQANDGYEFGTLGSKTAVPLVIPGQYEVTVGVPGAVESETYSEIIVMVDASSSQGGNLTRLKAMLVELAEEVLHNDGSVRLTLMGFGMGPAYVGSFYNAQSLETYLAGVEQGDLRQGVSATNCEAALEFVDAYIAASPLLDKTVVLFTSDGESNMDETPYALSTWLDHPEWYYKGNPASLIVQYVAGAQADLLLADGTFFSATTRLYPELSTNIKLAELTYGLASDEHAALVDELYKTIVTAVDTSYVDAVWAEALASQGMGYGDDALYSTSDYELAFLNYHGGALSMSYLVTIHNMENARFYPDSDQLSTWGARAADAADVLAANPKVLELYMVDFRGHSTIWMNPASGNPNAVTSSNVTYLKSSNYAAALEQIKLLGNELFTTVYRDVTVTDPMSAWVALDPSSVRVYRDDTCIWQYGVGWLVGNPPVAGDPVALVQGEDGRHTITWRIKDGNLLYTDRYTLRYIVDVDETAPGFEYGAQYPANDPTSVSYTDEHGATQVRDVPVPDVTQPADPQEFEEGDLGIKIYKSATVADKPGTPIANIVFDIYLVPVDATRNLIPTPDEVAAFATGDNYVTSVTTNGAGYTSAVLAEGTYLLVERPNAAVVAPADPFYLILPYTDPETDEPIDVVSVYPKNQPVDPDEPDIPPSVPEDPEPDPLRVAVYKHAQGNEQRALAGATFQVFRVATASETATMAVTYGGQSLGLVPAMIGSEPVTFTTGADGYGTSPALPAGLYFLVETKAPAGYNILADPVPVFVTATSHLPANAVAVANVTGALMPSTGGAGTWPFVLGGGALAVAAAVLLVRKVKREAA